MPKDEGMATEFENMLRIRANRVQVSSILQDTISFLAAPGAQGSIL
jgi:hypothetical protein